MVRRARKNERMEVRREGSREVLKRVGRAGGEICCICYECSEGFTFGQ